MSILKIVAKTDIGLVRSSNQDSYAAGELPGSVAWAVVCDGMGGVAGGNYASSTAVNLISKRISSSYRPGMSGTSIKNMLTSAIVAANISVYDMGQADSDLTGMGTTVVVAIIADESVYIAHVGDSRAYILSNGKLTQLTKDHSFVQEMVDSGKLTVDEAKEDAVLKLGAKLEEDVQIEIISLPKKKVLGIFGGAQAEVRAYVERPDKPAKKNNKSAKKVDDTAKTEKKAKPDKTTAAPVCAPLLSGGKACNIFQIHLYEIYHHFCKTGVVFSAPLQYNMANLGSTLIPRPS